MRGEPDEERRRPRWVEISGGQAERVSLRVTAQNEGNSDERGGIKVEEASLDQVIVS